MTMAYNCIYLLSLSLLFTLCNGKEESCAADKESCLPRYAQFHFEGWTLPLGLFSNQLDEVNDVVVAVKFGNIPEYLDGSLYRVGAALYSLGNRRVNNLCDGLAKLQRWSFNKATGEIRFTSKFLRSDIYNRTMATGNIVPMAHMGEIFPPLTLLEKTKVILYDSHNDNNNIAMWDLGKLGVTATSERPLYIDVDFTSLDYLRKYNPPSNDRTFFEKEFLSASHFNKHPTTKHSINYKVVTSVDIGIISGKKSPAYHFYEYKTIDSGDVVADFIGAVPVEAGDLRVVHSFGVTENYVILPLFCMCLEMKDPTFIGANIYWDANKPSILKILSIKDGSVMSFKFNAFESQHNINSFERSNDKGELEVVTDFPTRVYPVKNDEETVYDMLNIDYFNSPNWKYSDSPINMNNKARLTRFVMNTITGEGREYEFPVMWTAPKDTGVEFPTINPAFRGRPYCFVYLQVWNNNFNNAMGLIKVDMCKETSIGWEEMNKFPVEPIFTARPGSLGEDDGVVMSPVLDSTDNSTSLYVWDAKNLEVLAIVSTPITVPFTLHGVWIDGV